MSYVNLLIHAVVRTKASEQTLPADDKVKFLYQEMWGIIKNKGGYLYRINSMPNHVHLLFTMPATISLSEFMQALKGSSSKILKTKEGFENFVAWGERYAALSKSMEDKQKIVNYIINQQEHHKTITFKDEYIHLSRKWAWISTSAIGAGSQVSSLRDFGERELSPVRTLKHTVNKVLSLRDNTTMRAG